MPSESTPGRDRIVAAVVTVTATHGLDAISVRRVAAEAGVTGGMVQHHFHTKRAMLRAAMDFVSERVTWQVRAVLAESAPPVALTRVCHLLVPLDDQRAEDGRVTLAFLARAAVDEDLAVEYRRTWQRLEDVFASLFASARGRRAPAGRDRTAAALLLATLDGLATAGLVETVRLPPERIEALLDRQVDALLRQP